MRTAQVSDLKDRLDEVIDAVKNGETVAIQDGSARVARVVPDTADRETAPSGIEAPMDVK